MNIVLTGATGGVGQVIAQNLEADHWFLLYRNLERIQDVTKSMSRYSTLRCDVTDEGNVKVAFEAIDKIDVLINNAGITTVSKVKYMSPFEWDSVFDTNLRGAFLCSKYAIPKMQKGGHIVNISSVTSRIGSVGASAYAASKGGLEAFTRSLALELVEKRIFVNALSLGFFETGLGSKLSDKVRDETMKRIPLNQFGDPMEIVRAIEFIISSEYLVGATIELCGGL